jgi:TolB-like protein/DNA-binding winged helix-turn-helix (wHTH) protein
MAATCNAWGARLTAEAPSLVWLGGRGETCEDVEAPMSQPAPTAEPLRFGVFELDLRTGELRKAGVRVSLQDQPLQVLSMLTERPGELVTREDLKNRLWPGDTFVDFEQGLNAAVKRLRYVLGDSADTPRFIETLPRRGYRFIAPVDRTDISRPTAAAPRRQSRLVLAAVAAAVLLVVGVVWGLLRGGVSASRATVAVLPFEHLSAEPEREYLTDGLTEETSALLGQIDPEHIDVIGRTSTRAYKGTRKPLAEIGRELGAEYLVEGSVRAESRRLRVTSKLIRVRDQVQMWSATYDSEPASMLEMQRELSTAIAEQIRLRLSPERLATLARRHTRNADAYDLYLRGRYLQAQLTPPTTRRAIEHYGRATRLDPDYALAWSGLADAYTASPINGDASPLQVWPRSRDAVAQAIRAEPNLAEAQASQGLLQFWLDWDWPAAEAALGRSMALDPSYSDGPRMLGVVLSHMGRHEEARAAMRRARSLDPLSAMIQALSAQIEFAARAPAAAVPFARQAIVVDPEFWVGYFQLAQAYEQLGRTDLALDALGSAGRFSNGNSKSLSLRAYVSGKAGNAAGARDILRTLETVSRDRYVPPYAMALVHAGLEEREPVFEWLDKAYAAHDVHLTMLPIDPKWDPYRIDPRFTALVARCGFMHPKTTPAP